MEANTTQINSIKVPHLRIAPKTAPRFRFMVPERRFYLLSEENQREYHILARITPVETVES